MLPTRGYIFIGLNIVRVISIIALILVFASSILVMVDDIRAVNAFMAAAQASGSSVATQLVDCDYIENSTVPNQPAGLFWAVANRLFVMSEVVILVLSEVCWPAPVFERFFPVLGPSFGLGPLGIFQVLIGATILSQFADDFTLVAAFFLFSVGCLNILLGLIFRTSARSKRSITEWRSENKGVLPSVSNRPITIVTFSDHNMFNGNEKSLSELGARSSSDINTARGVPGFGRQGSWISKSLETLPRHAQPEHTLRSSMGSNSLLANQSRSEFQSSPRAI